MSLSSSDVDVVCSAPGKIILFGEHSVVHGRPAVAASAGGALRCYARVQIVRPTQSSAPARVTHSLQPRSEAVDAPGGGEASGVKRDERHRTSAAA